MDTISRFHPGGPRGQGRCRSNVSPRACRVAVGVWQDNSSFDQFHTYTLISSQMLVLEGQMIAVAEVVLDGIESSYFIRASGFPALRILGRD